MAEMKVNEDNIEEDLSSAVSNLSLKSEREKTANKIEQRKADSDEKEQHGPQHGSQTPEQKKVSISKGARSKEVQRALAYPEKDEKKDGKWLEGNPWKGKTPDRKKLQMDDAVNKSKEYTVTEKWLKKDIVDLKLIYSQLPTFIQEMKGPSIRKELEDTLQMSLLRAIDFNEKTPTPHVLEIIEKENNNVPADNPSFPKKGENNSFKAFSLEQQQQNPQPSNENYWYLDCEYMLKMYLPSDSKGPKEWFDVRDQKGKRIKAIKPEKRDKRWVFIPSFRRAKIALLDWPEDDIVTQESTIRILVVRPSEFDEYVRYCGHEFPIICLPQDEIGAGYPRYWIQKIALRLTLRFIWMIDDSVECFYEYHPDAKPPEGSYKDYRRRKFGLVFERIEKLVKEATDIVAMSPKRFRAGTKLKKSFVCRPPQIAVFLNLVALQSKNVYYRPELQVFEDMMFAYECEKNGLKVFVDNRVHLQDHRWNDTGAESPSVQRKPTELARQKTI